MQMRNLIMALIGFFSSVMLYIYNTHYASVLDHPYMIIMISIFTLALLVVIIYFFNVVRVNLSKMFKSCKHDYHLVNQFELKSEFDIVIESGKVPNTHLCMQRTIVTDYKCSKCKKLKRLKVKTAK